MAVHTTYLSYFGLPSPEWEKFIAAGVLGGVLILLGYLATRRLRTKAGIESEIVPTSKFSLFGFFDLFIEAFASYYDSIMGPSDRRHLPFVASVFLFIFSANLLGLVPGIPAATTTVWVNVAMAIIVFGYFNWQGVKVHGLGGYLKHFAGPLWWLGWFIFPLEIFSTTLRVLTLNLRLYWNITADHLVLGIFTDLTPYLVPVVFYVLGTFVCFMQAFIFTTLTMVYILLASQHEEGHGDENGVNKAHA